MNCNDPIAALFKTPSTKRMTLDHFWSANPGCGCIYGMHQRPAPPHQDTMNQFLLFQAVFVGIAATCQQSFCQETSTEPASVQMVTLEFREYKDDFLEKAQGNVGLVTANKTTISGETTNNSPFRSASFVRTADSSVGNETSSSSFHHVMHKPVLGSVPDYETVLENSNLVKPEVANLISSKLHQSQPRKREIAQRPLIYSNLGKIVFGIFGIGIVGLFYWQTKKKLALIRKFRQIPQPPSEKRRTRRPRRQLRQWL